MNRPGQLERAELNEEQARIYDAILETRGSIAGPFGIWLHSPELADRAQSLGEFVRYRTCLEPRLSELAILVTARFWDCQVEWSLHEPFAAESGLNEGIIDAVRHGRDPDFGRDDERAVYEYVSELLDNRFVPDDVFNAAQEAVGTAGVVELTGIAGYYSLVAQTLNAFQVRVPEGCAPTLVDCPTFNR
ncbi:MAG: carboxymuconolactone decarboxylase family protein [Gemmatimonadota bacterium]|nr:carboxymuconolactone decarboxylase family protein [Gemmatimonadota bacterium]